VQLRASIGADLRLYGSLLHAHGFRNWHYVTLWFHCPGLIALTTQRLYFAAAGYKARHGWSTGFVLLRIAAAAGRFLTVPLTHSLFAGDTPIEGGVFVSNLGNMIVGASRIGQGTLIHHRVTIGRNLMDRGRPAIGKNVWIGPDCVLFGDIVIGDGVTILPQTVVTRNVPAGAVLQGNPPRLVRSGFDNSRLRASIESSPSSSALEPR
jgi:serine acetyltransferase